MMAQPELKDFVCSVTIEYDLTFQVEAEDTTDARDLAEEMANDHDLGGAVANIHCHEATEL